MHRHHVRIARAALAFALLLPAIAAHAGELYLYAENGTWGHIQGEATAHGHEGWIECLSFQHAVTLPIGPNGVPNGPAQTTPLTVTTALDRATVRLLASQAAQEDFTALRLDWVEVSPQGQSEVILRFELFGAFLAEYSQSAATGSDPFYSLSFSYATIYVQDLVEGTMAVYDWNPFPSSAPETAAKGLLLSPTPNPTQGPAEFRFSLPADSNAVLALYDLRGHRVRELHSGFTPAGGATVAWDGTDNQGRRVAQGVYVARLTSPGLEVTERLTVLR